MKFNKDYVTKVGEEVRAATLDPNDPKSKGKKSRYGDYEIDAPDGFAEVPVQELCRAMDASTENGMQFEDKVLMTRYLTLGKRIVVSYDGKEIGSAQMTGMLNMFDAFPVWKDNPLALRMLMNVCEAYLLKKSLPPQLGVQLPAAEAATAGPRR